MKEFKGRSKQRGFFGIGALVSGLSFFEGASLAVGAVGLAQGYSAQQGAADAQQQQAAATREAAATQQRSANVQAQQERVKQLREARIARARVLSSSVSMGVGTASTGVSGAVSSISSQYGENVGRINVAQTFAEKTSQAQQQAADFGVRAQGKMAEAAQWQQLSQLGFQAAEATGGFDKIFSPSIKPAQAQRTVGTTEFMSEPSIFKMG